MHSLNIQPATRHHSTCVLHSEWPSHLLNYERASRKRSWIFPKLLPQTPIRYSNMYTGPETNISIKLGLYSKMYEIQIVMSLYVIFVKFGTKLFVLKMKIRMAIYALNCLWKLFTWRFSQYIFFNTDRQKIQKKFINRFRVTVQYNA